MKVGKLLAGFGFILVLSILFAAGCGPGGESKPESKPVIEQQLSEEVKPAAKAEEVKPAVEIEKTVAEPKRYDIALKPVKGQTTKYKLVTESIQSVEWVGQLPTKDEMPEGRNYTRVEMTFDQEVKDINENGNVAYQITIDVLKLKFMVNERPIRDFDSSRGNEQTGPLAKLVGQSYTVEMSADGDVVKVDAEQARSVFKNEQKDATVLRLLDTESIKGRHGIIGMPARDKKALVVGDTWSSIETFSFGLMGSKAYEKIYTLKDVTDAGQAVAAMEAIPSADKAEELHQKKGTDLSGMFSSSDTYKGELILDLKAGQVEKYNEKLNANWTVVDPLSGKEKNGTPTAMTMGAQRSISIEKID